MPAAPEEINVPSDPAPQTEGFVRGFTFNLGHQETDRIVDELEQVCKQVMQSAGDSWMTCNAAANIICSSLGYEDQAELEVLALTYASIYALLKKAFNKLSVRRLCRTRSNAIGRSSSRRCRISRPKSRKKNPSLKGYLSSA